MHDWVDAGDRASYHHAMPMWRCPHCATPQAEAARCWVCHRSSTSCASCRDFRRSITAGVGFCGRDRGRGPLNGQEIRPCWVPVIALQGIVRPGTEGDATTQPERITVEALVNADSDSGRFWRDADR